MSFIYKNPSFPYAGVYFRQMPLTQWRSLVGVGNRSPRKTCPRCDWQRVHTISTLDPSASGFSVIAPSMPCKQHIISLTVVGGHRGAGAPRRRQASHSRYRTWRSRRTEAPRSRRTGSFRWTGFWSRAPSSVRVPGRPACAPSSPPAPCSARGGL